LRDTVSDKGEEIPQADASRMAVRHLALMMRAYQRLGSWDKEKQVYVDLYQQLAHVFGGEDNWKNEKMAGLEKWQPKGADNLGVWVQPERFEFIVDGKHKNYLKKNSGTWRLDSTGHLVPGNEMRLSRSYSSRSVST